MKNQTLAIGAMSALLLVAICPSSAAAQAKAQSPAQALTNLYQAAQQIIKDPAGEYEKGASPDFPYPSQIQAQWDASMAANGNTLTAQERELFIPCAAHLNAAITDMEIGYRIQISQPSAAGQQSAQTRISEAPGEVAQCSAAMQLTQSEVGSAPSEPQQGGADAYSDSGLGNGSPAQPLQGGVAGSGADGGAIEGSASEAALPGSIDWTPALNPLQTYLSNEWQRVVNDPANKSWAADDSGNTLTLKLQPGQVPEVLSATGNRSSVFNNIMQSSKVPATNFPTGSTLTSVSIAPTFYVKATSGKIRSRLKYYERNGVFKSYPVAL